MHLMIGWWLDLRWSLALGVCFELWEWLAHSCENKLDLAYNTAGAVIGGLVRSMYRV